MPISCRRDHLTHWLHARCIHGRFQSFAFVINFWTIYSKIRTSETDIRPNSLNVCRTFFPPPNGSKISKNFAPYSPLRLAENLSESRFFLCFLKLVLQQKKKWENRSPQQRQKKKWFQKPRRRFRRQPKKTERRRSASR